MANDGVNVVNIDVNICVWIQKTDLVTYIESVRGLDYKRNQKGAQILPRRTGKKRDWKKESNTDIAGAHRKIERERWYMKNAVRRLSMATQNTLTTRREGGGEGIRKKVDITQWHS